MYVLFTCSFYICSFQRSIRMYDMRRLGECGVLTAAAHWVLQSVSLALGLLPWPIFKF